jgi:hypothetical protein
MLADAKRRRAFAPQDDASIGGKALEAPFPGLGAAHSAAPQSRDRCGCCRRDGPGSAAHASRCAASGARVAELASHIWLHAFRSRRFSRTRLRFDVTGHFPALTLQLSGVWSAQPLGSLSRDMSNKITSLLIVVVAGRIALGG